MRKILCIEDSVEVLMILEATLNGFTVVKALSLAEARVAMAKEHFSMVIIDVELPDGDGMSFYSEMAPQLRKIPVFFLTGRQDFATKAGAFALGADDFISKPFDPKELRLRVESRIKKAEFSAEDKSEIKIGKLVCSLDEQRVYFLDTKENIELTSHEFRIFCMLAQTPQKIFSRTEILNRVWGNGVAVTDRAVDVHVSNLRKKLQTSGVSVSAVTGSGYRLVLEKTAS